MQNKSRITNELSRLRAAVMSFACAKSTPVTLRPFCFAGGPPPVLAAHSCVERMKEKS